MEELSNEFILQNAKLSKDELIKTLDKVSEILDNESKLIEIEPSRLYILGDTHGNLSMSIHALKHLFPPKDSCHSKFDKIIFLGDLIDRGQWSVENINFLMSLKAKYPDRIILIRGNHETEEISIRYGFYESIIRNYGTAVFEKYTRIFAKLPLAILTWNKFFGVHGGIPEGLEKLSDLNGLDDEVNPIDRITFQLLWNDPVEREGWFFTNFRGGYSKRFGHAAFKHFIEKHDIRMVFRAHEPQKGGYKEFFDTKLISLDSSQSRRRKSDYKVLIVEENGNFSISEVHDFENKNLYKIFK